MNTVRAYYDGVAFIPIDMCDLSKGDVVKLSVLKDESPGQDISEKLAAFERFTNRLRELDETEPLPPLFDEIIAQGVNFAGEFDL